MGTKEASALNPFKFVILHVTDYNKVIYGYRHITSLQSNLRLKD
jgi:hypothetical protein